MPAPDDNYLEMAFPVFGVDISTEFELQPKQTTPVGLNVRGFEPTTQRSRGGNRPGIGKYIAATVNGPHLIQLLDIVIDPTEPALYAASDPYQDMPDPISIDDPSTSNHSNRGATGRRVRRGGNGGQPNRHYPSAEQGTANWFAGIVSGTAGSNYLVTLVGGSIVTGIPLAGAGGIDIGTGVILVRRGGTNYYFAPFFYMV